MGLCKVYIMIELFVFPSAHEQFGEHKIKLSSSKCINPTHRNELTFTKGCTIFFFFPLWFNNCDFCFIWMNCAAVMDGYYTHRILSVL